VPVFVVNGRISDSSYRGYSKVRPFFRRAVAWVDLLMVQSHVDEERLLGLGALPEKLIVTGSAKYDTAKADPQGEKIAGKILQDAGMNPAGEILTAGSTWPGEEELILDIFAELRRSHPQLQLILVPRHMERRAEVEELLKSRGLKYIKRTDMGENTENLKTENLKEKAGSLDNTGADKHPSVLLADTTGELMHYYSIATVVFVGKSMGDNFGGQNPIEPALFSKPIVVGPHMENFPGVMDDFITAKALIQVADGGELKEKLSALLNDADMRLKYGKRAGDLVADKSGVVARSIELIQARMNS
jgi:3-deoxy-D-manno-octulosonic-acid transferase